MKSSTFFKISCKIYCLLLLLSNNFVNSQTTKILTKDSVIINMGISPQTFENGLKPRGLLYNLLDVQKVPIIWTINAVKDKDDIDLALDGNHFRGGTFDNEASYASFSREQTTF